VPSERPRAALLEPVRSGDVYLRTVVLMSTWVTIRVVGHGADEQQAIDRRERVARAFEWFRRVEECCTRFDPHSEMMRLTTRIGVPVPVSALLYEAVQFAVSVAEESGGAFDPTIGQPMETRGFNREYRTGQVVRTDLQTGLAGGIESGSPNAVSYRDVRLDPARRTITLARPLVLDLGAVAKGLAIDMAARELRPLEDYAIDAGGDLYVAGCNPGGAPWSIGIRHPRHGDRLIDSVRASNLAVCTSGDYERRSSGEDGAHHILDPRTGASAGAVASVTVVAPTAMAADALATSAFVLGPAAGIQLLERQGVNGLMVSPALERYSTQEMWRGDNPHDASPARLPRRGPRHATPARLPRRGPRHGSAAAACGG
jgi:thiamine biosynthesis lipoprotein